jgi:MFS family permease
MLHPRPRPPGRSAGTPTPDRLRAAVAALFALAGTVFGSWAARIPDVADQVHADAGTLGLLLFCLSLGALASMQLTGALCRRLGSGLVAAGGAVAVSVTVPLPGLAGSVPELAVALVVFGAATGAVNVAANSVGVQVEQRVGRPVLAGLHAAFSFGGLAGAGLGALSADLSPALHLLVIGAAGLLVAAAITPTLVAHAGRAPASTTAPPRGPRRLLVVLGLIAGCTAYGEGAVTDWGALHLRETLGAAPAAAAAGYAAFSAAMAFGRLAGARLVRALGDTGLLVGGALTAALGALLAVVGGSVPLALTGFAFVGLGLANVFPLAIARAGALGGPAGVALAATVGYTGLLGGPPAVGLLAEVAGIPVALATVALLAVVAAGLGLAVGTGRAAEVARRRLLDGGRRVGDALRPTLAPPVPVADSVFQDRYRDVRSVLNGGRSAVVPA